MKAVRLHPPGGPDNLVEDEIELPLNGPGEVLVQVHAAAITRDELHWNVERLPSIPSFELSGVVAASGRDVRGLRVGDAVFGLTSFERDGVAAEYAAVPSDQLALKPKALTHIEASAMPLAGLSAWQGLFDWGHLIEGQRVLIHGGGGGVGLFAVQVARRAGAHVTATATGPRVSFASEFGANEVIDHISDDFTAIDPVHLVFDTVGGDRLERSVSVVEPGGRIVSVAARPPAGLGQEKGVEVSFFIVEPNATQLVELAKMADRGELRVSIDSTYPLHRARAAFERLQSGETVGKVVLTIT